MTISDAAQSSSIESNSNVQNENQTQSAQSSRQATGLTILHFILYYSL